MVRRVPSRSSVIVRTDEELLDQRRQLLDQVRGGYEELRDRAENYQLTAAERNIWETIRTIDYLLNGR